MLQQLSARLRGIIRETDLLFRWGGEEFVILMPHTGPGEAPALAERIRVAVAERPFVASDAHPAVAVTVSLGVAGTAAWPVDPDALLARADAACYRAKEGGRNRVESETADHLARPGETDEPNRPRARRRAAALAAARPPPPPSPAAREAPTASSSPSAAAT